MDISQSDVDLINNILAKKAPADGHFLAWGPQSPMIYGADGPQRIYLDLLLTARDVPQAKDVATMPKADHPLISNYYLDWNVQGKVFKGGLQRTPGALGPRDSPQFEREVARRDFSRRVVNSQMGIGSVEAEALKKDPVFAQKLVKGIQKDNPALKPSADSIARGDFDDQIKNFGVRRACKFLIYDAIQNGRKVAYVLDDLDLTEVVEKKARLLDPDHSSRRKVPVCTSEIREIFRRWDMLKDHVVFFRWFRKAPAPWESDYFDRHAYRNWSGYAKQRAAKLAGKLGTTDPRRAQLLKVGQDHDAGNFFAAIDGFHACKPSTLTPLPSAAWDA